MQSNSLSKNNSDAGKYLFEKDFKDVCSGSKVANAAPYDKTPGSTSPIIFFYEPQNYQVETYKYPMDWQPSYPNLAKTQLVACITVSERKEAKVCTYEGKYKLKLMAAKYSVKVYDARTGALLVEKIFKLSAARECSSLEFFSGTERTDEPAMQPVTDFLKPLVKH